ncbi:hypothetical protein ES319_D06G088400v1 [Gossypium barbadense]|uniref:Zinc finger RING-H2-type domain-containing protein n=1 Tax=Gossypium barbadense TaxID=3634 RepID=A0A5J5R0Y3_GOSBA|nr:hypothetical protein ES319_D06G088400v1 [Gossypium barbadense]
MGEETSDVVMVPFGEASSSSASSSSTKKPKRKANIVVDNCAICRNHIMHLCIKCQANQASATGEKCTVHTFSFYCFMTC